MHIDKQIPRRFLPNARSSIAKLGVNRLKYDEIILKKIKILQIHVILGTCDF